MNADYEHPAKGSGICGLAIGVALPDVGALRCYAVFTAVLVGAGCFGSSSPVTPDAAVGDAVDGDALDAGADASVDPSNTVNAVFDYLDGYKIWQGDADVRNGVVVGDYILFARQNRLFVDRFR